MSSSALGRTLIDDFAKGWSKANLDLLMAVFTEEAVFIETPFVPRLTGTAAIRRWWADVPYYQSEITVTTGEIFVAGPWFSTEFKAVFRRRRTGDWVEAKGAIFCETDGSRISEMRMYWHRAASNPDSGVR
ncbi:MAG: nuclear transport factor 2 family protein [Gemmatimonadota bacterium]|nr:nuclear transport factor 2 family protein [Gemmatimonadota bacterium]